MRGADCWDEPVRVVDNDELVAECGQVSLEADVERATERLQR